MRVISGTARRLILLTPSGMDTRPTLDRVKEALFSMLAPDLMGCHFLDLFSGSGGIGIEALSRGAASAVFVDSSNECKLCIEKNLEKTGLSHLGKVLKQDAVSAIVDLGRNEAVFDIIFMDPPYASELFEPVLQAIVKSKILSQDGYIVVERSSKSEAFNISGLKTIKEKVYRTTTMSFLILGE